MSYLAKLKELEAGGAKQAGVDLAEGRIIAVEICSTVIGADIWLAFDDGFDPGDGQAVFYADELALLKDKTAEQLCEIHRAKLAFGSKTRVAQ